MRARRAGSLDTLDRATAHRRIRAPKIFRQRPLGIQPFGDVFDGRHHASDPILFTKRTERDELLHELEVRGRAPRRTGNQVMMKRRREHLRLACFDHAGEHRQQPTPLEVGENITNRPASGGRGRDTGDELEPLAPGANRERCVYSQDADCAGLNRASLGVFRSMSVRPGAPAVGAVGTCRPGIDDLVERLGMPQQVRRILPGLLNAASV